MVSLSQEQFDPLHEPVAVIGSGLAGLITAHVLLQDGFVNVELLTRDKSVGGVWSEERVYPGLSINRSRLSLRFVNPPSLMRSLACTASTGFPPCRCAHLRVTPRPEDDYPDTTYGNIWRSSQSDF